MRPLCRPPPTLYIMNMAHTGPGPSTEPAAGELVDFALRNAMIKTLVCTRQVTEHGGYECARRTIRDYNYIYVTRGSAIWHFDDESVRLDTGDLVIVPPGVPHRGEGVTQRLTLGSIHLMATLPGGQDLFELLRLPRHRRVRIDSKLWQYLNLALNEFDRGDLQQTRLMMPAWGRLTTLELVRYDFERGALQTLSLDPIVQAVLEKLNRDLAEPLTLDDLAEFTGFSPQHLNRVFNEALGTTPLQYLARMRMERAAALLTEGLLTVKAVAEQVGYSDPYYFSRVFKQHFGTSPSHFRDRGDSENPS